MVFSAKVTKKFGRNLELYKRKGIEEKSENGNHYRIEGEENRS